MKKKQIMLDMGFYLLDFGHMLCPQKKYLPIHRVIFAQISETPSGGH